MLLGRSTILTPLLHIFQFLLPPPPPPTIWTILTRCCQDYFVYIILLLETIKNVQGSLFLQDLFSSTLSHIVFVVRYHSAKESGLFHTQSLFFSIVVDLYSLLERNLWDVVLSLALCIPVQHHGNMEHTKFYVVYFT